MSSVALNDWLLQGERALLLSGAPGSGQEHGSAVPRARPGAHTGNCSPRSETGLVRAYHC